MAIANKTFLQISRFDQIVADLRERINLLEFAMGSRIPSERKLAEEYQCSQATMNKVVSTLISEDLLERTEQRGAFVKEVEPDDITLMGWLASDESGRDTWKGLFENSESLSDAKANVITQLLHHSELQEIIILFGGKGEAPDVAQVSRNWTGRLSSLGLLEKLEDKLPTEILEDHLTWATESKEGIHQLKSIDYGLVPMLLYINCDLLEQCGLDSTKDPKTLNEFIEMIEQVNQVAVKNERGESTYGYLAPNLSNEFTGQWFLPWLYGKGGSFLNKGGQLDLAGDEAVEALSSYRDCLKASPRNISAWDIRKLFEDGRSAFLIDGPRGEDFFKDSKNNIRVVALPKDPLGNSSSFNANHALALFSQSKNQSSGIKLIEKILSDSQLAELNYRKEGIVPTRRSLLKEEIYSEPFAKLVIQEALNGQRPPSHLPSYQLAIGLLGHAVSRVLNEDVNPVSVLKETVANIQFILNQPGVSKM